MKTDRLVARSLLAGACAITGVVVAEAQPAAAAPTTFTVDTASDNPSDGLTLREAIVAANANDGADTIEFAADVTGTIEMIAGQMDITDSLTVDGPGSGVLTVQAANGGRVLASSTPGIDINIEGLTFTGTLVDTGGGAVWIRSVDNVRFDDLRFVGNAAQRGGGARINSIDGDITITGSTFEGNTADERGGGLFIELLPPRTGAISISGSTFADNRADGQGGGFDIDSAGAVVIDSSTIDGNDSAGFDGGLALLAAEVSITSTTVSDNGPSSTSLSIRTSSQNVSLDGVTITGNSNESGRLGQISGAADVSLIDVTISDNITSEGGITVTSGDRVDIVGSRITGNSNESGSTVSAIALDIRLDTTTVADNSSTVDPTMLLFTSAAQVNRSTFAGNTTTGAPGALQVLGIPPVGGLQVIASTFSGNVGQVGAIGTQRIESTIYFSTIVENTGALVGGIEIDPASGDTLTLGHTIVAENDGTSADDLADDATADWSVNGDLGGVTLTGDNNQITDPMLEPLSDNGGPTETHLPSFASPVIDAGDPGPLSMVSIIDQRGRSRGPDRVDIGAVERRDDDSPIWVPVAPGRLADTRPDGKTIDGVGQATGRLTAASELRVDVAGRSTVPTDAEAAIVNVTAVGADGVGFVTAHACLGQRPVTASLNYTQGVNLGDEIIVSLNDLGDLCLFTSAGTHLTVDLVGYVPANSPYAAVKPDRLLDTRSNGSTIDGTSAGGGAPGAGQFVEVPVQGRGGVPDSWGGESVVVYIAAVTPGATGFVTAWNCAGNPPLASSLNFVAGVNRGNELTTTLSADGTLCLFTSANTELTLDVVGLVPSSSNFDSLATPSRILDTRVGKTTADGDFAGKGRRAGGSILELAVSGRVGIPADVTTVSMNLTAIGPDAVGFVTAYPCGGPTPNASSLNHVPSVSGGNEIITAPGVGGTVCLFVSSGVDLAVDVTGFTSL